MSPKPRPPRSSLTPGNAPRAPDREIPRPLRILIMLYLAAAVVAIALMLLAGAASGGIFLVIFALPWSLFVSQLTSLLGFDSAALNLALLSISIGINAALLYLLGRWLRGRQSSQ